MLKIPIISISINESLKKFINKLVSKNQYENKSKLIRDALLRLMSSMDVSNVNLDSTMDIPSVSKSIVGNLIIIVPNLAVIQKKLNRIESEYKDQIVNKNQYFHSKNTIIFMIFEGPIQEFQKIVVEISSIKEIKNFRYLIVN